MSSRRSREGSLAPRRAATGEMRDRPARGRHRAATGGPAETPGAVSSSPRPPGGNCGNSRRGVIFARRPGNAEPSRRRHRPATGKCGTARRSVIMGRSHGPANPTRTTPGLASEPQGVNSNAGPGRGVCQADTSEDRKPRRGAPPARWRRGGAGRREETGHDGRATGPGGRRSRCGPSEQPDLPAATRIMQRGVRRLPRRRRPRPVHGRSQLRAVAGGGPTRRRRSAALVDGDVVGSNFATRWGSVGCFGPLTVAPDCWDRGVASRLLEPTLDLFAAWDVTHAGLFTFPHSPKHVGLYQKFGFWPRYLTAVMAKPVSEAPEPADARLLLPHRSRRPAGRARRLPPAVGDALRRAGSRARGDGGGRPSRWATRCCWATPAAPDGFAVCHCGAGTEAGAGRCYVKFGAARPGAGRGRPIRAARGRLPVARRVPPPRPSRRRGQPGPRRGVPGRCARAGFRTVIQGVCMHRPHEPGYHRPGLFVIDDWR